MRDSAPRALVLRHFAALRRKGLTANAALDRLAEGTPPGALRDDCLSAARALAAGGVETRSLFTSVLTSPTGTPEQAEALAEAFEAKLDADDALSAPTFLLQLVLAGPLVLLSLMGWVLSGIHPWETGNSLPTPTQLLVELCSSLRFTGVPLALTCILAVRALRTRFSPGFRAFTRAVALLEASTLPEGAASASPGPGLNKFELQLFAGLRTYEGGPSALRTLATELRREGQGSVATFRSLAPVVGVFLIVQFYLSILIALYLPIFSLAGAIK